MYLRLCITLITLVICFTSGAYAKKALPNFDILNLDINQQVKSCKNKDSNERVRYYEYSDKHKKKYKALQTSRILRLLNDDDIACQDIGVDEITSLVGWEHDKHMRNDYISIIRNHIRTQRKGQRWSTRYNIIKILGDDESDQDVEYFLNTMKEVCAMETNDLGGPLSVRKNYAIHYLVASLQKIIYRILKKATNDNLITIVVSEWKESINIPVYNKQLSFLLGLFVHEQVKDALLKILTNARDGSDRRLAASLLGNYSATADVIKALKKALKDDYICCHDEHKKRLTYSVRMSAASSLRKLGVDVDSMNLQIFP